MSSTLSTVFNSILDSTGDPPTIHGWLIGAAILGSFLVAGAIIAEDWPPHGCKSWLILVSVVLGVVIEAGATVFLFQFDEGITTRQQELISDQNNELVELRKIASDRSINVSEFTKELRKNKRGMPVQVFYLAKNRESYALSIQIRDAIDTAQWTIGPLVPKSVDDMTRMIKQPANSADVPPIGITVSLRTQGPGARFAYYHMLNGRHFAVLETEPAHWALHDIISKTLLGREGFVFEQASDPDEVSSPPDNNTIWIIVGEKP